MSGTGGVHSPRLKISRAPRNSLKAIELQAIRVLNQQSPPNQVNHQENLQFNQNDIPQQDQEGLGQSPVSALVPVISANQNTAARVRWNPPNVAQKEQGLVPQILNDPLVLKIQAGKPLTRLEYSQLTRTLQ